MNSFRDEFLIEKFNEKVLDQTVIQSVKMTTELEKIDYASILGKGKLEEDSNRFWKGKKFKFTKELH